MGKILGIFSGADAAQNEAAESAQRCTKVKNTLNLIKEQVGKVAGTLSETRELDTELLSENWEMTGFYETLCFIDGNMTDLGKQISPLLGKLNEQQAGGIRDAVEALETEIEAFDRAWNGFEILTKNKILAEQEELRGITGAALLKEAVQDFLGEGEQGAAQEFSRALQELPQEARAVFETKAQARLQERSAGVTAQKDGLNALTEKVEEVVGRVNLGLINLHNKILPYLGSVDAEDALPASQARTPENP